MEKLNKYCLFIFLAFIACESTKTEVGSEKEYVQWLNQKENGCFLQKNVKNISFTSKFLTSDFLALRELNLSNGKSVSFDSLKKVYENGFSFYFRIDPVDAAEDVDIMYADVKDADQFRQRVYDMNFNLKEMFTLEYNGKIVTPSLFHLENDYGMTEGRGMHVVFPNNDIINNEFECTLVFEDMLFMTGVNKFKFKINREKFPEIINAL